MNILAVECSAVSASCAVLKDNKLLAEYFINNRLTHSATLMPMIEHSLKISEQSIDDISAIAVSFGPGSFTGIRIGICTVKGLAAKSNLPCVPVSSLEGMAYGIPFVSGIICAVMDARCAQVYNALFSCNNGKITRLCEDRALSVDELNSELSEKYRDNIYLIGDGAGLCFDSFTDKSNMTLIPENLRFQRAGGIALAAQKMIDEGKTVSPSELLPFYLRKAKIN